MSVQGRETGSNRNLVMFAVLFFLLGLAGSYIFLDLRAERRQTLAHSSAGTVTGDESPVPSSPRQASKESSDQGVMETITDGRNNALVRAAEMASAPVVSVVVYTPSWIATNSRSAFQDMFDLPAPGRTLRPGLVASIGSGFLVDPSGVVLTNEHVVRDAEQTFVNLTDGRTVEAKLIGADAAYDLAVLKIDPGEAPLPAAQVGDSDDLLVGEWSIAIGNPFGSYLYDKQHTVTVGVISALHRDVKNPGGQGASHQAIYKDMIQTDAAINPGNSGGPLVNGLGQVVGVNTFIFTQGGGSLGIGFAIPINTAVRVAREIIQYGRVRHVNLGIRAVPINATYAAAMRIRDRRGLVVTQLDTGSPAAEAGMEVADIIRQIDATPVTDIPEAQRKIFGVQVGDTLRFTVERGGQFLEIPVRAEAEVTSGG